VDAFIERANVNRYRFLLTMETDELKRRMILRLLAETEALQRTRAALPVQITRSS
jgi:hypothetical protein